MRNLARLTVVPDVKVVMVLVLVLLNDIHQMDVGLLNIKVERVDLLESVNGLQMQVVCLGDAQVVLGEVDVADARVRLEPLLVFGDPQAALHFEFVVGQEHPPVLRYEFQGVANVVHIFVVEEVAEVQS